MTVVALGSPTSQGIDFESIYDQYVPMLIGMAVARFHISESDAQALAHEIFLAYFLKADDVRDVRAWLVGAMCNASRQFLKKRMREAPLPDEIVEEPDPRREDVTLPNQIAAREAIRCVTARCQLALRLRYIEGYTIQELAAELKTTPRYAQNLVSRCLQQARDRCGVKGKK